MFVALIGSYLVSGQIAVHASHAIVAENQAVVAAQHEAAQAQQSVAAAHAKEAAVERKLEAELAAHVSRHISAGQRKTILDNLKDAPKGPVEVYIYDYQDPEVTGYAGEIRDLLVAAGFDCGDKVNISPKPYSPQGLFIVVRDPVNSPAQGGAIQHAFGAVGIDVRGARDDSMDNDRVVLVVGRRVE